MPSSTSSSSDRIPAAPYALQWAVTGCLVVIALGASELAWRSAGYLPDVEDSRILWSRERAKASSTWGQRKLAIVGASRAQLGIDPQVLEKTLPTFDAVHLAINAVPPLDVLRDLCTDPDFNGVIVCSATALSLLLPSGVKGRRDVQYVTYYNGEYRAGAATQHRVNAEILARLQSTTVVSSARMSLKVLVRTGFKPDRLYLHMRNDRYRLAQYRARMTPTQLADHRRERIARATRHPPDPFSLEQFRSVLTGEFAPLYRMLKARGGEMVLVRMPTTDKHWEMGQRVAPKEAFWDDIEKLTGIATIHFADHAQLSAFECPDTSHLDATDAPEFTRRLGTILQENLGAGTEAGE